MMGYAALMAFLVIAMFLVAYGRGHYKLKYEASLAQYGEIMQRTILMQQQIDTLTYERDYLKKLLMAVQTNMQPATATMTDSQIAYLAQTLQAAVSANRSGGN